MTDFVTQLSSTGELFFSHHFDEQNQGDTALTNKRDNNLELIGFLSGVERRAFRMAEIATGNKEDALDILQDAMMTLVKSYGHKQEADWGPLFHRILQSRIRDWYRRNTVRNKLRDWLGLATKQGEFYNDKCDPIQSAVDFQGKSPEDMATNSDAGLALESALQQLPRRQQQAFLLRNWQGLDVKQTAMAMACSEGSVKTHYSRAVHRLRAELEGHYEPG